jgi:exosortase
MTFPRTEKSTTNYLWVSTAALAFFVAYFPVWKRLVSSWATSEDNAHGFFILPVFLYIVWRRRADLVGIPRSPSWWGLVIVLFSLMMYIFSHFAEIMTLGSYTIIFVSAGVVVFLFGFSLLKELFFPFFLLFFMIPVPSQIYSYLTIPLQLLVSKASVALGMLAGIPAYREGNVIYLPNFTLQVVQACSGLRSMVSLLAMGAIVGYLTTRTTRDRIIIILCAVPVAIIVNIFRVFAIEFSFYYFHYDLTVGSVHTLIGVLVFLISLAMIIAVRNLCVSGKNEK